MEQTTNVSTKEEKLGVKLSQKNSATNLIQLLDFCAREKAPTSLISVAPSNIARQPTAIINKTEKIFNVLGAQSLKRY